MKVHVLSVIIGIFYVVNASDGNVSFIGEDQEFRCEGNEARWILPNRTQVAANSTKYKIETIPGMESKLTVKNVNPRDIGPYRCVSDKVDQNFDLQIYYPLTIDDYTRSATVKENENVTLRCKSNGIPEASVQWFFGNSLLVEDSNVKFSNGGVTLTKVQPDQAGSYACVVIQELGTLKNTQERDIELIVEYGPRKQDSKIETVYGQVGSTIKLECYSKSTPNARFVWHRNGYQIYENVENFNDMSRLTLKLTSDDLNQNFTCQASNNHGQQDHVFLIDEEANRPVFDGAVKENISFAAFIIPLIVAYSSY